LADEAEELELVGLDGSVPIDLFPAGQSGVELGAGSGRLGGGRSGDDGSGGRSGGGDGGGRGRRVGGQKVGRAAVAGDGEDGEAEGEQGGAKALGFCAHGCDLKKEATTSFRNGSNNSKGTQATPMVTMKGAGK